MTTKTLKKVLAGREDLLIGTGTETQTRGASAVDITKLDFVWPFNTLAEIKALDTTKFTRAILKTAYGNLYYDFNSASADAEDDFYTLEPATGTGRWKLSAPLDTMPIQYTTDINSIDFVNIPTGFRVKSGHYSNALTAGSDATLRFTGTTTLAKAGQSFAVAGDGYTYDLVGRQFGVLIDNGLVNTLWFGGGQAGFKAAAAYLQAEDGGTVFVGDTDTVNITSEISIAAWTKSIRFLGSGMDITSVKANADDLSIFTGTAAAEIDFTFENLELRGYWADNPKQSSGDNWLVIIRGLRKYLQHRCRFVSSQKGLVNVQASVKAESTFCEGAEAARGGFNFSGSGEVRLLGNDFVHLGDDAISAHVVSGATFPYGTKHIIIGNTFRDCQGIAALGARVTVIQGNVGKLIRARFIFCGVDAAFSEGFNTSSSLVINGNVCEDCLNKGAFDSGASNVGYYMQIYGYPASTGGSLDSFPGTMYATTPAMTPLYGNMNGVGNRTSNIMAGSWNTVISDNILVRTEADGVEYTSYGQTDEYTATGEYFTDDGYASSTIDSTEFSNPGVEFRGTLSNFALLGGIIQTGYRAIRFTFEADDPRFTNGYVGGGIILKDAIDDVISTDASSGDYPNILDVTFENMIVDGDPFFRSALRSALDGTWSGVTACRLLNIPFCVGVRVGNVSVKNVSRLFNTSGGGTPTRIGFTGPIIMQCDPVATGDSASNKGIRNIEVPSDVYKHEIRDFDPSSSTYGQLERSALLFTNSAQPSSGTYVAGEFVRNTSRSEDGNNMMLLGWQRLTTGTGHVAGTDWETVYASTVSPAT